MQTGGRYAPFLCQPPASSTNLLTACTSDKKDFLIFWGQITSKRGC